MAMSTQYTLPLERGTYENATIPATDKSAWTVLERVIRTISPQLRPYI